MPGVLRVRGTIDVNQFWPNGEADADTTKILVATRPGSFAFAADGRRFVETSAFDGAEVRGTSRKKVIDSQGRIVVRLQGIDAPELHYSAPALKRDQPGVTEAKRAAYNAANRAKRRQYLAETATVALSRKLGRLGSQTIACEMISFVDQPNEVIDTYGRFVGNIRVGDRMATDINEWLTAEGWVVPTFYSSMLNEEIETLLDAARRGEAKGRVWDHLEMRTDRFDPDLIYRGADAAIDPDADLGPVLIPKLFRRQVSHEMQKAARVTRKSFADFLASSSDKLFLTADFLDQSVHSAPIHDLSEFVYRNRFVLQPQQMVFREKFSTLVDRNNREVTQF